MERRNLLKMLGLVPLVPMLPMLGTASASESVLPARDTSWQRSEEDTQILYRLTGALRTVMGEELNLRLFCVNTPEIRESLRASVEARGRAITEHLEGGGSEMVLKVITDSTAYSHKERDGMGDSDAWECRCLRVCVMFKPAGLEEYMVIRVSVDSSGRTRAIYSD